MRRTTTIDSLTLPFNPASQFVTPYFHSSQLLLDNSGNRIGHPTQSVSPAIPDDISDDILTAIQTQLALLGLVVTRA